MSNFDPNAVLRGAQLTIVGAYRALQNPNLFKHDLYKHAARAIAAGVVIQVIISIPVYFARGSIWTISLFKDLEAATWDDKVYEALHFFQHSVLQVPFFLMNLLKHISPFMDTMFMESLEWVDITYYKKHESEDPTTLRSNYHANLKLYTPDSVPIRAHKNKDPSEGIKVFLLRYGRKAGLSMGIYLLTFVPFVGKFVLPAVSFLTFKKAVGDRPAVAIFACGLVLPRKYLVMFLQTYFASRSMMRELLEPYFSRVPFSSDQKKSWFFDREGVLFGFGVAFFLMIKIPIIGVLVYGIAEASTAYLITKITDPPPPPATAQAFAQSQVKWTNKKEFITLPLDRLDTLNVATEPKLQDPQTTGLGSKTYT